jgi:hypothetical protein
VSRRLGLHCVLYLSADRVCTPPTSRRGGWVTESLGTSQHRLARLAGAAVEAAVDVLLTDLRKARVRVPCQPRVEVLEWDLGSRLLLAALLECRDAGRVGLRLAEPPRSGRKRALDLAPGRVRVTPLPGPPLDGLCGLILQRLERDGEQGAQRLLGGVLGSPSGPSWVIVEVKAELAVHGYASRTLVGFTDGDCERVQALAEERALALDRWNRAWAADAPLCEALLADCTNATK